MALKRRGSNVLTQEETLHLALKSRGRLAMVYNPVQNFQMQGDAECAVPMGRPLINLLKIEMEHISLSRLGERGLG